MRRIKINSCGPFVHLKFGVSNCKIRVLLQISLIQLMKKQIVVVLQVIKNKSNAFFFQEDIMIAQKQDSQ